MHFPLEKNCLFFLLNFSEIRTLNKQLVFDFTFFFFFAVQVKYKLRDWLFARQRYWGEPFPLILVDGGQVVPIPEEDLPLTLPEIEDFSPTGSGEPPLAKAKNWVSWGKRGEIQGTN